jgi:hypothetical protein
MAGRVYSPPAEKRKKRAITGIARAVENGNGSADILFSPDFPVEAAYGEEYGENKQTQREGGLRVKAPVYPDAGIEKQKRYNDDHESPYTQHKDRRIVLIRLHVSAAMVLQQHDSPLLPCRDPP